MKKISLIIILAVFVNVVIAQQLPITNQGLINKFALSPAFAGLNGNIESFIGYRESWLGIKGAPSLTVFDFNGVLQEKMGYGFSVISEKTGSFRHIYLDFTYAYHVQVSSDMVLSFALTPKVYRNQMDLSEVNSYGTQLDPAIQNKDALAGTTFDAGIGILFSAKNLHAGVSIPRTIGMSLKYKDTDAIYKLKRHYMMHASYGIYTGSLFVEPLIAVRMTGINTLNYETGVLVKYKQRVWTQLDYRAGNFLGFAVGGAVNDRMVMNYRYETGFGGISTATSGTHEVTIGFLIKPNKKYTQPTIFPEAEKEEKVDAKMEQRLAKLEKQLKDETTNRESEIKRLEKKIDDLGKELQLTSDNAEAKNWADPFVLDNIKFGNGSNRLFSSSYPELNKIVNEMKQNPDKRIRISGYTDNMGSQEYNKKLSEKRAQAVAEYLVQNGIAADRIESEGLGDAKPLGDNATPEGRAINRRIEAAWNKK